MKYFEVHIVLSIQIKKIRRWDKFFFYSWRSLVLSMVSGRQQYLFSLNNFWIIADPGDKTGVCLDVVKCSAVIVKSFVLSATFFCQQKSDDFVDFCWWMYFIIILIVFIIAWWWIIIAGIWVKGRILLGISCLHIFYSSVYFRQDLLILLRSNLIVKFAYIRRPCGGPCDRCKFLHNVEFGKQNSTLHLYHGANKKVK